MNTATRNGWTNGGSIANIAGMKRFLPVALVCLLAAPLARAQAPGVAIESGIDLSQDKPLAESAAALRDAHKLLDLRKVNALLAKPKPVKLTLPATATEPLAPREIYRRARAAFVRVGWFYQCPDCDEWHLDLSGGYAITSDGTVATAAHVLTPDKDLKKGYLVAATADGKVLPVTSVLAMHEELDAAVVRVEGLRATPLPLNDNVAPGDAAFCLSDPLDLRGYFTAGIVNRFYWLDNDTGDAKTLAGVVKLRLNVSTDWAPGSSGTAVLDACGNAIGHAATIAPVSEAPPEETRTKTSAETPEQKEDPSMSGALFQMHDAVPARGLLLLLKTREEKR
jgi:hypothetical protein